MRNLPILPVDLLPVPDDSRAAPKARCAILFLRVCVRESEKKKKTGKMTE